VSNLSADVQETETTRSLQQVEVRTDARLAAVVGGVASVVAIAYLARAIGGGGWLDWALVLVTGAIAAAYLQSLVDARVPLLVVDEHGVRLRKGRTWHGLPWRDIECIEHDPRHGLFGDGRLILVPRDADAEERSVRLSLSTRVVGADGDLTRALERLADEPDQVVETSDLLDEDWDESEASYTWLHYIVLVVVAFVLGLLVWKLLLQAPDDSDFQTDAAAPAAAVSLTYEHPGAAA